MSDIDRQAALDAANATLAESAGAKRRSGKMVPLPGGKLAPVEFWAEAHYAADDSVRLLTHPHEVLRTPNTNEWTYKWVLRNDPATLARMRSGELTPIKAEEVNWESPLSALTKAKDATGEYIIWKSHVFVKTPRHLTEKQRITSEWRGLRRVTGELEKFAQNVERESGGTYKGTYVAGKVEGE